MNSIQEQLGELLLTARPGEGGVALLEFCYPETFLAFQGHFSGNPILPGICLLQSLRIGLERIWDTPLRIAEIVNAKFLAPVHPDETILFTARGSGENVLSVKAKVTRGDERVAEFALKLERLSIP